MSTASELKQQGNTFFKSGSLAEAARCFAQAEIADSTDVVYPSNLSAALYEMGDYAACLKAIVRAWRLLSLSDSQASGPLVQRLSTRLAKALCHGGRCGTITRLIVDAPANQRATAELSSKGGSNCAWDEWNALVDGYGNSDWDKISHQAKIGLSRLPIFRCPVYPSRDCYMMVQEAPMSLFDDRGPQPEYESPIDLSTFTKKELGELSFLLAGIGDARHVYATLVGAERAYFRLPRSKQDSFQLHITMLDTHPAPLARDLCVMLLLNQLVNVRKGDATEKVEIMATIFYVYAAVVIPSYCEKRLLSTIEDLIDRLANVPPRLPTWMHVNLEAIDPIMEILRIFDEDSLAKRRQDILNMLANGTPEELAMLNLTPPPRSAPIQVKQEYEERKKHFVGVMMEAGKNSVGDLNLERVWYQTTKVLMPPKALWSRHPQFEFYERMDFNARTSDPRFTQARTINSHVSKTWKPNWTLFDKASGYPHLEEFNPFFASVLIREFNARFSLGGGAAEGEARPLSFYYVSDFFQAAAKALTTLTGRVTLEFICGDPMQELSKMRFNGSRQFPRSFTRIYLSNILHVFRIDYTHGIINTVAFALPVVKCKEESLVTASTFLSPTIWKDDAEFIYTYTLLRPDDVERFLGCRFTDRSVIMGLTILGRAIRPPALIDLASRPELEAWLVRTLIYTLAPGSSGDLPVRVRLPNNVVAFFTLLVHLHSAGYPSHWLGELVQRIVSNEVVTGVTPYRGRWPIPISDAHRMGPVRRIRLDPWAPDFENIFAIASRGLPFHVNLPSDYETHAEGICVLEATLASCIPKRALPAWQDCITGLLFYRPRPGAHDAYAIVKDVAGILEGRCGPPPGEVYILTAIDSIEIPRVRWKMGRRRFEMMRKAGWSVVMYHAGMGEPLASPVPAQEWREVPSPRTHAQLKIQMAHQPARGHTVGINTILVRFSTHNVRRKTLTNIPAKIEQRVLQIVWRMDEFYALLWPQRGIITMWRTVSGSWTHLENKNSMSGRKLNGKRVRRDEYEYVFVNIPVYGLIEHPDANRNGERMCFPVMDRWSLGYRLLSNLISSAHHRKTTGHEVIISFSLSRPVHVLLRSQESMLRCGCTNSTTAFKFECPAPRFKLVLVLILEFGAVIRAKVANNINQRLQHYSQSGMKEGDGGEAIVILEFGPLYYMLHAEIEIVVNNSESPQGKDLATLKVLSSWQWCRLHATHTQSALVRINAAWRWQLVWVLHVCFILGRTSSACTNYSHLSRPGLGYFGQGPAGRVEPRTGVFASTAF
ncbi:hypothetical protein BD779DRAFT_1475455 [Infundibulicybe gibba]|nr:hypothetical protein BD779DRAFT_1475455 [Infundibulicybe gibba]